MLCDSLRLLIGTFDIVRDFLVSFRTLGLMLRDCSSVSGLSDYLLGHDVIEWNAASLPGITEGMSCEAVKPFWYRVNT